MKKIIRKIVQLFQDDRGLSLLEILVALTIMVLITMVGLGSYRNSFRKARDSKRQTDLELVRGALEIYRTDVNTYPVGSDFAVMIATLQTPTAYINTTPVDPRAGIWDYYYLSPVGGATHRVCAYLEGPVVNSPCTITGSPSCNSDTCNYCVCNP